MIPKEPKRRSKQSTSFKQSIQYILNESKQEEGDTHTNNLIDLDFGHEEMRDTAKKNHRVTDPVYHVIFSWPSDEKPEQSTIFSAASYALESIGFDLKNGGHQAVFAIHRDTDNLHVHVIANRIHSQTGVAVDLWQSQQRLHKACRELELQHQWMPDNGAWIIEDGEVIRKKRDNRYQESSDERDVRSQIGHTFGDYVRSAGATRAIQSADNWTTFHQALHHFNLVIQPRGGGFVIVDRDNPDHYHAQGGAMGSRYKGAALIQRYGPYQPPEATQLAVNQRYHDPQLTAADNPKQRQQRQPRDPAKTAQRRNDREALYAQYNTEKQTFIAKRKPEKTSAWDAQKQREKTRWNNHLTQWRETRQIEMAAAPRGKKRIVSSTVTLEKAKDKARIDQLRRQERQALKTALRQAAQFPTWRQWVREQANTGDPVAVSLYRGLRYRAKGDENIFSSEQTSEQTADDTLSAGSIDTVQAYDMERGVGFWRDGEHFATDYGRGITVHRIEQESVELSLRIALSKWGGQIEVQGTDEFVQLAQSVAASMQIRLEQRIEPTEANEQRQRPRR